MAGPCFWRELSGVVQQCGDDPEPEEYQLLVTNGYAYPWRNPEFFNGAAGFEYGIDFELRIELPDGPTVIPMVFEAEGRYLLDGYVPVDATPGIAVQGGNQWNVFILLQWS
ncbi:hypothetical protein CEE59_08305 [Stenotrophomonas maltophilia]|uniref:hypothetical protein n=1 Tax=Stenotrophomonas maltophilia TaxID=40324 RepID=UPI000B4E266C|nr:hypothetical protein [Stenotrophomonas maltophilia]OWQ58452.1 hypothetical protein CEE59_08305 [Stenotrophomonas maltophilia]PZS90711.1 hypothetical protein A7X74_18125 [Stenotrophomonas maltophilia]